MDITHFIWRGNYSGRHPARDAYLRKVGDWVWRRRLFEGYEVLTAGTKLLSTKTRRKASRALRPFLRAGGSSNYSLDLRGGGG